MHWWRPCCTQCTQICRLCLQGSSRHRRERLSADSSQLGAAERHGSAGSLSCGCVCHRKGLFSGLQRPAAYLASHCGVRVCHFQDCAATLGSCQAIEAGDGWGKGWWGWGGQCSMRMHDLAQRQSQKKPLQAPLRQQRHASSTRRRKWQRRPLTRETNICRRRDHHIQRVAFEAG